MMRLAWLAPCLLGLAAGTARAASPGVGTASGEFLRLGVDARAIAMGSAYGALAGDASAVYWNPAGLSRLRVPYLTFTHTFYVQSIYYDFIAYAQPIQLFGSLDKRMLRTNTYGTLGVGVMYLNAGKIDQIDNTGTSTGGSYTPSDVAATVAWGIPVGPFDFGASAKYISERIDTQATTVSGDVGAKLHVPVPDMPLIVSASGHNLFGGLRYINATDPLPRLYRIAAAMQLERDVTLAAEYDLSSFDQSAFGFGAEYRLNLTEDWGVAVRGGYNSFAGGNDLEKSVGAAFGFGIRMSNLLFDYAFSPMGVLGDTHRITLGVRF
jgi:hypothetical protein